MFKIGEAQIRVSEITQCFYCGTSLPATKKEHIFNSCWGGSHSTTKLICDDCNVFFSQSVDASLSAYVSFVMNAWSFKGERHKRIPEIETEDGFVIGKYGKPRYKEPQIVTEPQLDGTEVRTGISFNSKDEAYKFLREGRFDEYFGRSLTSEEQQLLRQAIREAEVEEFARDDPNKFSVSVNLQKQYRSAAHTLLKCMGMYAPEWIKEDKTKSIRDFVRHDVGDWTDFAVDVEQLVPSAVEMMSATPRCNTAEIYWCRSLGKVVGVLTLLGRIQRSLVLVDNYQGETSGMLYLIEGVHGSKKPPRSFFMELDCDLPIFPLLEIRALSSSSDELFGREIGELIWRSLYIRWTYRFFTRWHCQNCRGDA